MSPEGGVLVVHCSDPRYQAAFHEFLRKQLGLQRYALLAVPGGPQFLTAFDYLPKFGWAGWRWVKFLNKLGSTDRVILIAHEDCRWYLDMGLALAGPLRQKQLQDMRAVRAGIQERFGSGRVELYYAQIDDGRASFEAMS